MGNGSTQSATLRRALTGASIGLLGATLALPAAADTADDGWQTLDDLGLSAPDAEAAESSILEYSTDGSVLQYSTDSTVRSLDTVESEGEETTISLATDILFTPNSWDLPGNAASRIEDLVADIPDGAQVQVTGHTDSTPTGEDFDNQELSENRAEAVADVLREARSDLELDVSGQGSSQPAVQEDPDDPSTFAANRRVEIVYEN